MQRTKVVGLHGFRKNSRLVQSKLLRSNLQVEVELSKHVQLEYVQNFQRDLCRLRETSVAQRFIIQILRRNDQSSGEQSPEGEGRQLKPFQSSKSQAVYVQKKRL